MYNFFDDVMEELAKVGERRDAIRKTVDKHPVCGMISKELAEFISELGMLDHTVDENDWSEERWEAMGWKNKEPPRSLDELGKKISEKCVDPEMGWDLLKICAKKEKKECVLNAERNILFALLDELSPLKKKL